MKYLLLVFLLATIAHGKDQFVPVCDRSPDMRINLELKFGKSCGRIAEPEVNLIRTINFNGRGIIALKRGDFSGMFTLWELNFSNLSALEIGSRAFEGADGVAILNFAQIDSLSIGDEAIVIPDNLLSLNIRFCGVDDLSPSAFKGVRSLEASFENSSFKHIPDFFFAGIHTVNFSISDVNLGTTTKAAFAGVEVHGDDLPSDFSVEQQGDWIQ